MVICGRCFQFPPQLRGESCRVGFNRVPSLSQQESLAECRKAADISCGTVEPNN